MHITSKLRRNLRLQNTAFVILFLAVVGLAAWLTNLYATEFDWTAGNRNTLSEASRQLLKEAEGPITITAYASDRSSLRKGIRDFVARYKRAEAADIRLNFVNPNARPERVRELGIQRDGQLVVAYQGRSEKVDERSEQALSNAIQRVMRAEARKIRFLTGHGERSPEGDGRTSLARFASAVEDTGVKVATLNLAQTGQIPEDTAAVVIASPTRSLLEAEVDKLEAFVERGGNLLWLTEQGPNPSLQPLAAKLGLQFLEGQAVDPRARVFGLSEPTQVMATQYPNHAVTRGFDAITVFPGTSGLKAQATKPWQATALVKTNQRAWLETGEIQGEIRYQKGQDQAGPITLAVALTRPTGDARGKASATGPSGSSKKSPAAPPGKPDDSEKSGAGQRLVVTADSDFLTNAYIGSAGNRQMGLNLVHWLTADESFINVQPASAPGTSLNLPAAVAWVIPMVFLGLIPLLLIVTGTAIWLKRRRL